jgi:PAS domain-containing protein
MQALQAANVCLTGFICYAFPGPPIQIMKILEPRPAPVERKISWEQILSSVEDGVITLDRSGKVSFFNEAAEILTDLAASRALSLSLAGGID